MKRLQFGRSMIEMLGVLAIIGVLSIGGMSMYRKAILNYRLGQTQQWFETVRCIIAEACANGNQNGCFVSTTTNTADYKKRAEYVCSQGGTFICPEGFSSWGGSARTPLKESVLLLHMNSGTTTENIQMYLHGLDKRTCEAVIDYDWNGLVRIANYTHWTPSEPVQTGQKSLTREQKDRLKVACPFPEYMIITFDLKS